MEMDRSSKIEPRQYECYHVMKYDPVGAVKEIDKYVKEEGFKGVRVVPWLWALPPTDRH